MMYENKKKNGRFSQRAKMLVTIAMVLFVVQCLGFSLLANAFTNPQEQAFEQTKSSIIATNNQVATLIAETQAARVMASGTPRP